MHVTALQQVMAVICENSVYDNAAVTAASTLIYIVAAGLIVASCIVASPSSVVLKHMFQRPLPLSVTTEIYKKKTEKTH